MVELDGTTEFSWPVESLVILDDKDWNASEDNNFSVTVFKAIELLELFKTGDWLIDNVFVKKVEGMEVVLVAAACDENTTLLVWVVNTPELMEPNEIIWDNAALVWITDNGDEIVVT